MEADAGPPPDRELLAIEQELSGHQMELGKLLKERERISSREKALLSKFSRLGAAMGIGEKGGKLSVEEAASSIVGSINRKAAKSLHDAILHVYGHDAVKASGISTDSMEVSLSEEGIRYADPQAISAILVARQKLLNDEVEPGTSEPAWKHLDRLNSAISKHFGKIIPGFDPTEKKHWDLLDKMAKAVYDAMELHKQMASHIMERDALSRRISERNSLLEAAKKRLEEHKLKR